MMKSKYMKQLSCLCIIILFLTGCLNGQLRTEKPLGITTESVFERDDDMKQTEEACEQRAETAEGIAMDTTEHTKGEQEKSYESRDVDLEGLSITDYLALYAVDSFETDYIKLNVVEDLSYVYHRIPSVQHDGEYVDSISIYSQDYRCGWFSIQDFMSITIPGVTDWNSELGLELIMESMGARGTGELQKCEKKGDIEQYYFVVNKPVYTYGDTEWLVESGLFEDAEEVCKEAAEEVIVLFGKTDSIKGYCLSLNKALIAEKTIDKLIDAIIFKEGAFDNAKLEYALTSTNNAPYIEEIEEEIYSYKNLFRITYNIVLGNLEYRVPEHTIAIRNDEHNYDLYCYTQDGTGGKLIGTIYAGPNTEGSVNISYYYEELLFNKAQRSQIKARENTDALENMLQKYQQEIWITDDKEEKIEVRKVIFD